MRERQMATLMLSISLAVAPVAMSEVTSLIGDKDGFGVGCPIESGRNYLDYGAYYADNRDVGDPAFTDNWLLGDQSWTHGYSLGGMTPLSASLEIFVAGVENNTAGSAGVSVGGTSVGTIQGVDGWYDVTRILTFDVPVNLLTGSDLVLVDVSSDWDGWIIDYSQLTIETDGANGTTPIPAPGAFVLGGLGIVCLNLMRTRRAI